jgi:mannose/cellobiose epimerase-like protein (N-acyl-D-glucosamine 2-epimerase family)
MFAPPGSQTRLPRVIDFNKHTGRVARTDEKGAVMAQNDRMMKTMKQLAVMHFCEALIAYRAAKKRGKNPKLYFALTQVLGVFVLIPLLRKPKLK